MLFVPEGDQGARHLVRVSSGTDNQGNGFMLDKYMTTSFPAGPVLMETSAQLASRGLLLDLAWHRRDENVEADDLTNGKFDRFDPDKRIVVEYSDLKFKLLDAMMTRGTELYKTIKEKKEERRTQEAASRGEGKGSGVPKRGFKQRKLRLKAPWNAEYNRDQIF